MKQSNDYYTFQQQNELDQLLIKYHYARNFRPERMDSRLQDINDWKDINGDKQFAPYHSKKNTLYCRNDTRIQCKGES